MAKQKKQFMSMSQATQLMPQEELLMIKKDSSRFSIGVPKEIAFQEKRVAIVPSAVSLLVENGFEISVEKDAGVNASFSNEQYADAGAILVDNSEEIFQCDVILKVAPATMDEIAMMKNRIIIISALHERVQSKDYYRSLMQKGITALSYEHIRNNTNEHPILHSISEIVGSTSILLASSYLADSKWGRGKMLGGFIGINPSEVVILGAGVVAESAAKTALGLGALVKMFDNSITDLRRLQSNVGASLYSSIVQPNVLKNALKTADVVIGAIYLKDGNSAPVVTEEMVEGMKEGSVIIDVSIDKGGCVETSRVTNHDKPVFKKHGVTHYCVPNISSRTPHTSSYALSNYFAPFLIRMFDEGGLNQLIINDERIRAGAYIYNGKLTFRNIAEQYGMHFQDLNLMLAAFR
ncbi:MAG: alanine dehydrogenase [Bacteroidetes bacterium 4572_112]|nr:MAG: alanine dehydrogenase [Bacteroidetes bacterium 4572_112]